MVCHDSIFAKFISFFQIKGELKLHKDFFFKLNHITRKKEGQWKLVRLKIGCNLNWWAR